MKFSLVLSLALATLAYAVPNVVNQEASSLEARGPGPGNSPGIGHVSVLSSKVEALDSNRGTNRYFIAKVLDSNRDANRCFIEEALDSDRGANRYFIGSYDTTK
ncbi:hypothetical protein GQ44DRAFT_723824 [Phaeosphaeriaceae sp. PMI808]|nr:hypothetical protein GQ44DRAFT_723824 [Phaeosphaeriaceae sp. PMI808]